MRSGLWPRTPILGFAKRLACHKGPSTSGTMARRSAAKAAYLQGNYALFGDL